MAKFIALALCVVVAAVSAADPNIMLNQMLRANRFMRSETQNVEGSNALNITELTLTQRVDNFNPQNQDTFEQPYLYTGDFFKPGGPIIVLVGHNSNLYAQTLNFSLVREIASATNGYAVHLEHRYYGESRPVNDASTENLRYLTVDQALADLAHFVAHIRTVLPGAAESAVILTGRGYGGSLAVWFRQKYPHLAQGAWAAGAPVLSKLSHFEFKELAAERFRAVAGDECYNAIDAGFRQLDELVAADNKSQLDGLFNVCDDHLLQSEEDVSLLLVSLSTFFTSISSFGPFADEMCITMKNESTPLEGLVATMTEFSGPYCWSIDYDATVKESRNASYDDANTRYGMRQRMYQQCTQLGGFQTTDSPNQPFGSRIPLSFFTKRCADIFGAEINGEAAAATVDRLNIEHGGLLPHVTNVLFTHGDEDSSRSLTVREVPDGTDGIAVIVVPNSSYSIEFYESDETYDEPELMQIKKEIIVLVASWV